MKKSQLSERGDAADQIPAVPKGGGGGWERGKEARKETGRANLTGFSESSEEIGNRKRNTEEKNRNVSSCMHMLSKLKMG